MKSNDPIKLARLYGAKIDRRSDGRWICLDMPDTDLWTLTFNSIERAARAFLIVYRKNLADLS